MTAENSVYIADSFNQNFPHNPRGAYLTKLLLPLASGASTLIPRSLAHSVPAETFFTDVLFILSLNVLYYKIQHTQQQCCLY